MQLEIKIEIYIEAGTKRLFIINNNLIQNLNKI